MLKASHVGHFKSIKLLITQIFQRKNWELLPQTFLLGFHGGGGGRNRGKSSIRIYIENKFNNDELITNGVGKGRCGNRLEKRETLSWKKFPPCTPLEKRDT